MSGDETPDELLARMGLDDPEPNPVESVTYVGDGTAGLCECPLSKRRAHAEGRMEFCEAAFVLMPSWLAAKIPPLYAQEEFGDQATVWCKWFAPATNFTWYVTEFDPVERRCFGWVDGNFPEFGYFDLSELEGLRYGPGGALRAERDLMFDPAPLREIQERRP